MAAIPLNALGKAYVTRNAPWGKSMIKLGRLAWGPGQQPPQLASFKASGVNENLKMAWKRMSASGATPMTGKKLENYNKSRSKKGKPARSTTVANR